MGPSYQGGCRDDIWVGFVGSGKRIVRTIAFVVTSHRQYKTPASAGVFLLVGKPSASSVAVGTPPDTEKRVRIAKMLFI